MRFNKYDVKIGKCNKILNKKFIWWRKLIELKLNITITFFSVQNDINIKT